MAAIFGSLGYFLAILLACMSMLALASPIPFVITGVENIAQFEDIIARELVSSGNIPETSRAARRDDSEFDTTINGENDANIEPRICRFGCI
ncbi:hypothetical protein BJ138DRAFT_1157727 [Hygrophoropsis aurantiaca]|uniref:Uncharacterized protein n=1 Tax=Hygrophoropsis aurantiaca TaxID=72124 RepID=A0ACB8A5A4_9AGAM|nr:hypothetical protein BJ138DRAFT_1157727 [Hygrophoropsis aurantiaca]